MLFFGHVGISVGAAHLIDRSVLKQKIDLRKVALLSVAPDIIDKPLGLFLPRYFSNHTRLFGHSLILSICFLVLGLFWGKYKKISFGKIILYWLAFFGHMVLDRVWINSLYYFFWPALGEAPRLELPIFERWWYALFTPYVYGGELVGLAILGFLCGYYKSFRFKDWTQN